MRKRGGGIRARPGPLSVLAILWLGGCGSVGCADEVVQHVPSPYGPGAAVVFVRDCGATTGLATQVAVVGQQDVKTREQAVVFVADDDHGAAPSSPGQGPHVRVRWMDANHLEIAHHPRARTFRKETEHGTMRITYTTVP